MAYSFLRSITIDHTKCGATDSSNWTLCFTGIYSYLANIGSGGLVQNGSGFDIAAFADSGLTSILSWDMAMYVSTTGEIEMHIKLPTLSHTTDTVIYLAYGDASISTFQGGSAGSAYDSNTARVMHWGDGTTLSLVDSSANGATGTNNGGATAVAGKLGGALSTASSSNITSSSTTGLSASGSWTISVWIKSTMAGNGLVVKVGNDSGAGQEYIFLATTHAQVGDRGGGSGRAIGTSTANDGNWHYFVGTFDGSNFRIYVDGVLETTQGASGGGVITGGCWFGIQSDSTSPYTGAQDESRYITTIRSVDWQLAEFNNQNDPATFYTIGAQQDANLAPSGATITYTGGTPTLGLAANLAPGSATFTYTGGTPVAALTGVSLAPGGTTLTYTSGTPLVGITIFAAPGTATLAYFGAAASNSAGTIHETYIATAGQTNFATTYGLTKLEGVVITVNGSREDVTTLGVWNGSPWYLVTPFPETGFFRTPGAPALSNGDVVTIDYSSPLILDFGIPGPARPTVSTIVSTASGTCLYIGSRLTRYEESSGNITKVLSAPWAASFTIFHRTGDTYPAPGEEVAFFDDGIKRFGGLVQSYSEQAIKGSFVVSRITVKCTGYNAYMDRVDVAKLYPAATATPASLLFDLFGKLAQFGVSQPYPQGPAVLLGDQVFDYIKVSESVARVRDASPGYDYFIDDNKVAYFIDTTPTTPNAPFTLRNSDKNVDEMEVTIDNSRFRNKQNVLPSANLVALYPQAYTATAGQTSFQTDYSIEQVPLITLNGVNEAVTTLGVWNGAPWYVSIGNPGLFRSPGAPALSNGDTVATTFTSPFPLAVTVQDDASIAAVGLYEMTYQAKNVVNKPSALLVAQGLLDLYGQSGVFQTRIVFSYNGKHQANWLTPGMVLDVIRTFPTASGYFTVEQVDSQMQDDPDGQNGPGVWRHTVTCRNGLGDVTEAQALDAGRTAARVPINSPPTAIELEFDIGNAGQSTGLQPNRVTVRLQPGVTSFGLASWDAWFPADPPTGADWQCDVLASTDSGVTFTTIFPSGAGNKLVVPDGSTAIASGLQFAVDNLRFPNGTIFQANVLQVGSTNTGKYCVAHINLIQ